MYGPTETTVWSTCHRILPGSSKISIGKPIANTQIHILDADLRPTPLGVVGELCIAGDGVTLGYLNRSDLTKLAFIDNPFGSGKLYRTGDLARFSADGTIECLGRKDGQVKLRGYRIELGEIESVLGRHPSVKHCVTIVREDRVGDQRLVAYVVATGAFPDSEVFRTFLRQAVPDYMVPQHFVEMAAFPLTPNGKVDKKRLPAPVAVQSDDGTFEAPTTESEMIVQKVWQKVLGLPRVSANDDFFKLGGHSLLAAQVVAQVSRETGLEVSMRRVFDASLLKNFAKVLDEAKTKQSQSHSSIPIRANQDSARLSPMQQRVWFMEEMNPGTSLYNLGGAFRMHGKLNRDALERALNEIARRHSTMRTTIDWKDEKLLQLVAPELKFELIPVDLSTLPPADREAAFHEALVRDVHTPFDISKGPLVRSHLYHLGEGENALTFCAHHAIWDGWSFDILLDELDRLYTAFTTNERPTLPAIETTYGDYAEWFAEWMNGPELTSQLEFWKGQFAGEVPVLELPTDFPRPASKSFDGSGQSFRLSADLTERLSEVGQRHGVTFFMVLLAGFEILLHRLTSQGNIVIGTPMRSRSRPELEPLIGYFVNPLPLHFRLSGEMRIADLLEHTKQVCVNAFEHQDLPFDVLVNELALERDTSRTPLYSTFFTFQDARNRRASFGDLSYDVVGVETPICPTDLNLWTKRLEDGTVGALEYATDLFTAETAKRWVDEYVGILECIAQAYQHSVGAFPLRAVSQQNSVLAPTPVESDRLNRATLVDLFEEQVERTPASPAVSHGQVRLTYAELNERANRVANCLINRGISRGSLVGICLERSTDLLVATLAVQKCGAAYVPLDPSFPAERLRLMVEDSGLEWIILHDKTLDDAPLIGNVKAFDLSGNAEAIDAASTAPQARETGDTASLPAYVIYTSGSTGKPKGVVVSQRSLVNFVWSMKHTPGMAATDKLLAVTTLSFDIAVLELYVPLIVGAQVIIASRETALDGDLLDEAIDDNGITVMQATPSTWRLLIAAGFKGRHPFKILCGGEAFPLELAQKLLPLASEVWNMYGPTETTVWSTCQKLIAPLESIHIGKPIANTSVYVTGSSRELVPLGSVGELWIGGDGVAIGYHHRPDLTTERFIANPFGAGRVYKTGDLVRLRSGGELEYLRRNDNQVKIRGFRIELGEIETALARHPGLSQVVVMVREDEPGDTRLVAYLVASDSSSPEDSELRSYLKKSLPDYMVPQVFVRLPALPVTPNGKVDRKALPKPGIADVVTHGEFMAPRSNEEVLVANTWKEVLRISQVGLKDNFFDIGGHSLLCLQMTNQLEKLTGVRLNPRVILRNNLEQVAEILRNEMTTPTVQPSIQPAAEKPSLARRLYGRITGH
jgi:amino acid adenylation domain-containing protein